MAQPVIQTSFNGGEWGPNLIGRVDVEKYHSAASLLENFYIDYRGGATASPGTRYVLQTRLPQPVRLIPFQASLSVNYILEFGDGYVRFFTNNAPVLEGAKLITAITSATPPVVTSAAHGFSNGDWVYIASVGGMTQVNGNYYVVTAATTNTFALEDINGNFVNATGFGAYTSGGTAARVYTIASPYTSTELAQIKFAQNVNTMVICHPNHPPYQLVLTSATNWAFSQIAFGSTVSAPTSIAVTSTLGAGTVNYAYVITAVDVGGQESAPSAYATIASLLDLRTVAGTNTITWTAVTNAVSYNIYKAEPRYAAAVPAGSMFGFIGNCTTGVFVDSNISPDYSSGPPVVQNPFFGSGVQTVTVTATGAYVSTTSFPTVGFTGGGGGGAAGTATGVAVAVSYVGTSTPWAYPGDTLTFANGVVVQVTSVLPDGAHGPFGYVTGLTIIGAGSISSGSIIQPEPIVGQTTASGQSLSTANFKATFQWSVTAVAVSAPGSGYATAPTVVFSSGGAAAIATLGAPVSGNPTVPGFFQQRLVLAGPTSNPQQINMSQPGSYYNFDTTNPIAPDNAFSGSLVSGTLNTIQSLIPQPQGLIVLSDQSAWLLNGGSAGAPISATNAVANAQVFAGASSPPPIAAVDNILYVQAKNSIVRDLVFNFNKQVYTGADISVLSSHLFYGYSIPEWAWAEEPFKLVYAVRSDGIILTMTFLKEQELVAWTHRNTIGSFRSVATITESNTVVGKVNAVYTTVVRVINGALVQYIERFVEQAYPTGTTDAWQVDAGLRYDGIVALTFTGASHLAAQTVTGLATDNTGAVTVITPFTMPVNGIFTLPAPASPATGYTRVTIGIPYTPKLKTLRLDTGNPTIQGKMKKINGVTVRVANTLGLSIGSDFNNLVRMKDLTLGEVGTTTNTLVTNLVTGDAYTAIDPSWTVPGQYCIQQSYPYPATILGVIPQLAPGDTAGGWPTK